MTVAAAGRLPFGVNTSTIEVVAAMIMVVFMIR
jgi:hypothetical protein